MKRLLLAAALAAAVAAPVFAADVGFSVNIGQPGFYGQIDIGDAPRPRLLYRRPVMIEYVPVSRPPIYLNVRPGHARNWRRHCGEYGACGERVFFVQNGWYDRQYVPHYQRRHGDRYGDGRRGDEWRGDERRGDGRRGDGRRGDERHGDERGRHR